MKSKHPQFDRSNLTLVSIEKRKSDLSVSDIVETAKQEPAAVFVQTAKKILNANKKNASVILMMGAHVIRAGVQRYLIDMIEKGHINHIAVNGAGLIHDYELARFGETTESVAKYISQGQFGLWKELEDINDIAKVAAQSQAGLGETAGRVIEESGFKYRDISIFAAAHRAGVPVTVHVSIGCDIVHELPNCDGAAFGAASYRDFLIYTKKIESLENGVIMNFGSAVMGPEVFLKALAMVRNAAKKTGKSISNFTSLVCDLHDLGNDFGCDPPKDKPSYYFRPLKTLLVRAVSDGGEGLYFKGRHEQTIPMLYNALEKVK